MGDLSGPLEPFGDAAVRARLPEGADGARVLYELKQLPRVVDAVVTERHALVTFDASVAAPEVGVAIARALSRAPAATGSPPREHRVRVRYDGEDLEAVARSTRLSPGEVASLHAAGAYVVAAVGFLPGFAYLRGLDPRLTVARRGVPRPRVAPLSVAIAGPYTGVYPFASPGGWNVLGVTLGFAPFDVQSGAKLKLGDRVRFVQDEAP